MHMGVCMLNGHSERPALVNLVSLVETAGNEMAKIVSYNTDKMKSGPAIFPVEPDFSFTA
jgi:hypothetical protein